MHLFITDAYGPYPVSRVYLNILRRRQWAGCHEQWRRRGSWSFERLEDCWSVGRASREDIVELEDEGMYSMGRDCKGRFM